MTTFISDPKYSTYFFALKRVSELHRKFSFGKTPDIPSGFSESLCRSILGLKPADSRNHDAVSPDGMRLEIKATGTPEGRTTISRSSCFDILIWLYINFDKDSVFVYKLPRALFVLKAGTARQSIRLKSIAKDAEPTVYTFSSETHK